MKKHVGVITDNLVTYSKIRLLLRDVATVSLADRGDTPEKYDLLIADLGVSERIAGAICIGDGGDLPYCFRHEDLLKIVLATDTAEDTITLSANGNKAYLSGEEIKLTDVEFKLLEVILSADGFVSKQELLHTVWGEGYDEGVVNVYVHYLRRKLEKDGQKLIISSRNEGYRISDKYRRRV